MTKKRTKKKSKPSPEDVIRKLRKENLVLRKALAKACDWALDSADVIADENILDPEDEEENDFRATILELRALSKLPEAERHAERRKARITDEMVEKHARKECPELWAKIDANAADDDWNGATALNARNASLKQSREALEADAARGIYPTQ